MSKKASKGKGKGNKDEEKLAEMKRAKAIEEAKLEAMQKQLSIIYHQ